MRWSAIWLLMFGPALAGTTQWVGVYSCGQGATALKLTVIDDDPARLSAVFAFGPTPANATVPRGSFTLRGTRQGARITLQPDAWLEQPPDYEMVALARSLAGDRFQGEIAHEGCGAFALQRMR